jgi:hypothetical protein
MPTKYYFGSASFTALITEPGGEDTVEVTEIHIPGGSVNYVDLSGKMPEHLDLALFFRAESDYTGMRGLVGTTASMTYPGGSAASAALIVLDRESRGVNGESIVNAEFILV